MGAILTACSIPCASAASDITGHWAEPYITYMDEVGVINPSGSTGAYGPNRQVTRAEFMRYINRAFHFTEKASISYDDVPENSWFYETIQIATRYGYINGVNDHEMNPLGLINREEAFTILGRLMKANPAVATPDSLPFKDNDKISEWSAGYIKIACDKGIANGYENGDFQPQRVITRGEVAKILYGFMGTSLSQSGKSYTGSDLKNDTNNATIAESCMVSDAVIKGDLYITEGLDAKVVNLSNVTVEGTIVVSGGTVSMVNTKSEKLIISSPMGRQLSVTAMDGCNFSETQVGSAAVLYEKGTQIPGGEGFTNLSTTGNGRVSITLDAAVNSLQLVNESTLSLAANSSVYVLTVQKAASITGYGSVYQADIQVNGVTFANSVSVAGYTLSEGVSVTAGGQSILESNVPGAYPGHITLNLSDKSSFEKGFDIFLPADKTITTLSCNSKPLVENTDFTKTSTGLKLSSAFLETLSAGEQVVIIAFTDDTQETVTVNVSAAAGETDKEAAEETAKETTPDESAKEPANETQP